jgi:hypothetical protein
MTDASGNRTFSVGAPGPLAFTFERIEEAGQTPGETRGPKALKANLDGDPKLDLVVLGFRDEGGVKKGTVLVFFNDGTGTLGAPTALSGPDSVDSLALVQADADPEDEIMLLSGGSAYFADHDAAKQAFSVSADPVASAPGATLLVCGDFDGDGVEDLALGGGGQIQIFPGVPVRR